MRTPRLWVLPCAWCLTAALAQPLEALLPAETVVAVGVAVAEPQELRVADELAALPWEEAGRTLQKVIAWSSAESGDPPEIARLAEWLSVALDPAGDPFAAVPSQLEQLCPELSRPLRMLSLQGARLPAEALIGASFAPANPMPALTLLLRLPEADESAYEALRDAAVSCLAEQTGSQTQTLQQDGRELVLLGGGPFTITVAALDDALLISSNPEVARFALRRAAGAGEASFAETPLAQAQERFAEPGLRLRVAVAAGGWLLDELLEATAAGEQPRLAAALRTLGGAAVQVGLDEQGLVAESLLLLDPEAGDEDLAALLTCAGCSLSRPFLAPYDALGVTSFAVPVTALSRYLVEWAEAAGQGSGQAGALLRLPGIPPTLDLERGLPSWLGEQAHWVALEPLGSDLGTLLYRPGRLLLVPVSDEEEARQALARLEEGLEPLLAGLARALTDGFELGAAGRPALPPLVPLAVRPGEYRDVPYQRIQLGPNVDVAVAVMANHLVLASPAEALQAPIDTLLGGRSLVENPAYRAAVRAAPDGAHGLRYRDLPRQLAAYAELGRLLAQPLAFAAQAALSAQGEEEGGAEDLGYLDVSALSPAPLAPGFHEAELEPSDPTVAGELSDVYRLAGLRPGQRVSVVMESQEFDTFVYLADATGRYLAANDDAPDTSRSELRFTVQPGVEYWLQATSFSGSESGGYQLDIAATDAAAAAVSPPSFAELLQLFELGPEALAVLAAQLGPAYGYAATEGDVVHWRWAVSLEP